MALNKKDALKRFADEFGDDIKDEIEQHWIDEDYDDDMFEDPDDDVIPESLNNDSKYFEFLKKVINDNSNANPIFDPNKFKFKLKKSKIEEYKKLYKKHCSVLVPGGQAEDLTLATLISVGASNEYPFMQNLIDAYERTRLHLWNNNDKDGYYSYKFVEFAKRDCKFLVDLQKGKNRGVWDYMVGGCNSFYKRLFTQTQLGKSKRILDDYYTVCNIIIDTINLVNNQVMNAQDITPFQFDLCFVATDFRDESFHADPDGDGDDDDGYDDDDDDAKGDAKDDTDRKEENGVIINDIEFSLKQAKMKYSKSKFDDTRVNQSFRDHIKDNKKLTHKRFVCVNDFRVNERFVISDDNDFNFQIKTPQGGQLLYEKFFGLTLGKLFPNYWSFKNRKNDNDRPDILKTLPFGVSSKTEWLRSVFAKSNQNSEHKMQETTLVNKIGHETNITSMFDLMKKSDDEIKDLLKKYKINDTGFDEMKSEMDKLKVIFVGDLTGKNQNSDLFTVSFHVHSQDEIKAYILWGGQCLRFFPCDLLTIFKTWFQYKPNNDKETRLESDVKNLYLKDILFESFCVQSLKPEIYKDMFPN